MHFTEMIPMLAADCGVSALKPDAQGAVAVAFGALVVNLRPQSDPECVSLDARLGSVDRLLPETRVAMMADNRWPHESLAGALAVDAAGTVFLVRHVSGRCLSFAHFRSLLNRFAAQGARWRERLAADGQTSPAAPGPDPALLQALA